MTKPRDFDLECPDCGFTHGPFQNTLCTYGNSIVERPNASGTHITKPTVIQVLSDAFGSDFSKATQDQRLLLLEAVALALRTGGWQHKLHLVCARVRASRRPPGNCFSPLELGRNEGLKLMADLQVAIVEGYSVLAANERLHP